MQSDETQLPEILNRKPTEWQEIAFVHFKELAAEKAEKAYPVFALEHNFNKLQLLRIRDLLVKDFEVRGISHNLWLLWVIYATELGYEYTGDEYWQSFERKLKNWDTNHRQEISWAFSQFQKHFRGIVPTGTWAQHFRIISQPITNAILPRDLQAHFAHLLFISRHQLKNVSIEHLDLIAARLILQGSAINSTRFQNFLEQKDLVGRIAIAVLADDSSPTENQTFIHSKTLRRIVNDIEITSSAKEWIRQARKQTQLKPKIIGTGSISNENRSRNQIASTSGLSQSFEVRVRLISASPNHWVPILEMPRVEPSELPADFVSALKKERIKIPCCQTGWFPAQNLIFTTIKKRIQQWPSGDPLIVFERNKEFALSVGSNMRMSIAPWLFKIGSDGVARELQRKRVRPGKNYILLNPSAAGLGIPIHVECDSIIGELVSIPATIDKDLENNFAKAGLAIDRSVRIFPVGQSARYWDGEGESEWLTTESPCFGIYHDHEIEKIQISLGDDSITLEQKAPGSISYIHLDPLPVGIHKLRFKLLTPDKDCADGLLHMSVKEPEVWVPGITEYNGMLAFTDPNSDDLDAFLKGKIRFEIHGPKGYTFSLKFLLIDGEDIVAIHDVHELPFPYSNFTHRKILDELESISASKPFSRLVITIDCAEIGLKEFRFSKPNKPLRWAYREGGKQFSLRLIDETDDQTVPEILFFDREKPVNPTPINWNESEVLTQIATMNGLFWTSKGDLTDALVISRIKKGDLHSLSIKLDAKSIQNASASEIFSAIKKWELALPCSFFASGHIQTVVDQLYLNFISRICGRTWAVAEKSLVDNSISINATILKACDMILDQNASKLLYNRLIQILTRMPSQRREIEWFCSIIQKCGLASDEHQVRQMLSHAASPMEAEFNKELESNLLQKKELFKASRLMVLNLARIFDPFREFPLIKTIDLDL